MCSWLPNNLNVDTDACAVVWNGAKGNNAIGVQAGQTSTTNGYSSASPSSTVLSSISTAIPTTSSQVPVVSSSSAASASSPGTTSATASTATTTLPRSAVDLVQTVTVFVAPKPTGLLAGQSADEESSLEGRGTPQIMAFEENGQTKINITGFGFNNTPATLDRSCLWTLNWPVSELHNTEREDLVFIGFQFWVLGMSIVALLNESIPHIAASLLTHLMATGWAVDQITTTQKFRSEFNRVITNGACDGVFLLPNYWETRGTAELVVALLNVFSLIVACFLTWKLVKLFGWQTFKRVGASLTINRIYKIVLVLSIIIQLGLFFMLVTVCLWIDQLWNSAVGDMADFKTLYKTTAIITLIALIPWLMTGWFAVRRELRVPMIVFLVLSILYLAGWSLLFFSTTFRWTFVTWTFFSVNASASVFLAVVSFILGLVCRLNFGKGLPRYLNAHQSLSEDPGPGHYSDIEKVDFPSSTPVLAYPAVFQAPSESYAQPPYYTQGPRFFNNSSASPFNATPINPPSNAHVVTRKASTGSSDGNLTRTPSNSSGHGSLASFYSYGGNSGGGHSRQESNKQRWIIE